MTDYATLLRDQVALKCRCIDRIFLQAYVPKLQSVGWVCNFLRWQRRFAIPSSAAFGKIGDAYVKAIHKFATSHNIPMVKFKKGQSKEQLARPYLEAAAKEGKDRVVLIGTAQEKSSAWRSWPRKGQERARHPHMDWVREMAFVNHFYFYIWDSEWGGAFWKTNACGSTGTSGPSGNWRKLRLGMKRWIMVSVLARTPSRCRRSAIGSGLAQ